MADKPSLECKIKAAMGPTYLAVTEMRMRIKKNGEGERRRLWDKIYPYMCL